MQISILEQAEEKVKVARVVNRQDVIDHLKAGGEVTSDCIDGYSIKGGQYDSWTVRSDTLISLLQAGLISKEADKISLYNHYRWKTNPHEIPRCQCGAHCWKFGSKEYNPSEPCWGEISVSEDYPGEYTHFCEGHGHPEDNKPYKPRSKEKTNTAENGDALVKFSKALRAKTPSAEDIERALIPASESETES